MPLCKVALKAIAALQAPFYSSHCFAEPWVDLDRVDFGPNAENGDETWTEHGLIYLTVDVSEDTENVADKAIRLAIAQAPATGYEGKAEVSIVGNHTSLYPVEVLYDTPVGATAAIGLLRRIPASRTLSQAAARYFGAYEREPYVWQVPWYADPGGYNLNSVDSIATEVDSAALLCENLCPGAFLDLAADALALMAKDGVASAAQMARYLLVALITKTSGVAS